MLEKEEVKKAKTLLYAYRVLLTGLHVLKTGEIEANLPKLLEITPRSGVKELMEAKVKEKAGIGAIDLDAHRRALEVLDGELDRAFDESRLPEVPKEAEALDRFLISLRLRNS
jgi:predicted nucleotidyltransferase